MSKNAKAFLAGNGKQYTKQQSGICVRSETWCVAGFGCRDYTSFYTMLNGTVALSVLQTPHLLELPHLTLRSYDSMGCK